MSEKQYADRDIVALDKAGNYYLRHVSAMTGENLHDKSDIAAELAWRDYQNADLRKQLEQAEALLLKFTQMRTDARGFVHDFTMNVVAANSFLEALSPTERGEGG